MNETQTPTADSTPAPVEAIAAPPEQVASTPTKPAVPEATEEAKFDLPLDRMNEDEIAVVKGFVKSGSPTKIAVVATSVFPKEEKVRANSRVRNALRRLTKGEWIEQTGRGTYKLTASGKRRSKKLS